MDNLDLALVEHTAKAVDTILDTIYRRKPSSPADAPKSDCCIAPFERVMHDVYACSACGRICSDGRISC